MQPIRFVTAAALFDGHDAAINVIRRVLQDAGCEVVHLGHNRSVQEIVQAVIQEDADGVAISSYQGGHNEFFKYLVDQLKDAGSSHVQIFGGGGGVILPEEIDDLQKYGVKKIYSPAEGMKLGLEGMAKEIVSFCLEARSKRKTPAVEINLKKWPSTITALENGATYQSDCKKGVVVGITGTGGAGKSSLIDEITLRFLHEFPNLKLAIYSVDPTKKKTGGALLGDRIRMNSISSPQVFMRSLATRGKGPELPPYIPAIITASREVGFDLIIVETPGIGQASSAVTDMVDLSLYVMTSEYGAATQLEKIDMIDYADVISINKFDRRGSLDALQAVRKQYRRARKLFKEPEDEALPIFGTRCNIFNDQGVTSLYRYLKQAICAKNNNFPKAEKDFVAEGEAKSVIISAERTAYLSQIAEKVRYFNQQAEDQVSKAKNAFIFNEAFKMIKDEKLEKKYQEYWSLLTEDNRTLIESWPKKFEEYQKKSVSYRVRDREVISPQIFESLSGLKLKRVTVPRFESWDQVLRFCLRENLPGYFPFTAGLFPFKRSDESPRRQFAGEGPPSKTNKRFHYLTRGDDAKRLSTAFDSVTLYGEDPDLRPDIYGKVGESGVSIATVKDMAVLYDGFDLCDPSTSVSMTINGPAPMILAMFMNVAIDQQLKKAGQNISDDQKMKIIEFTLQNVRGTVQADILKEDQAQNTCIFSTEFALRMMADIQEYFIQQKIRNYYSVSISGYHIAEAGANPVTQLAFTLANGFTLVEYYLSRGMKIDDFAPNLSFFFSNGLDPEYSVLGRVARRIWAIAMRDLYGASERSQKLKYHIQTSGRSLHSAEIEFNDIRTTLQALTSIYDNCNSLHTNAYDEAITTPTEESVRRAMAIQMIINQEFGPGKTENILQGSYVIEELTDLVEEAVLIEFDRLTERGGVLGAMESQYQRSKIQEESMVYEHLKHTGALPLIGVNTFLPEKTSEQTTIPLARSNTDEKNQRLKDINDFWKTNTSQSSEALEKLKKVALEGGNIFAELMETVKVCSLGQISNALYQVGGRYRRNM